MWNGRFNIDYKWCKIGVSTKRTIMLIVVNGEPRNAPGGQTILELLHEMSLSPERVAVELNRVIVKRPEWGTAALEEGARLEIVQFVGGG